MITLCSYPRHLSVIMENIFRYSKIFSVFLLNISVGSEPKLGSARLGFGSSFWEKKLGLARLAMPSKKLGSARHILQKKLGLARLAL